MDASIRGITPTKVERAEETCLTAPLIMPPHWNCLMLKGSRRDY